MNDATTSPPSAPNAESDTGDHPRAALLTIVRLRWFIRLRWVFLGAAIVVLVLERLVVPGVQRPPGLHVVLGMLGCVNLVWLAISHLLLSRLRETTPPGPVEIFANAQVAVDLLLLTCILRFAGGSENPMAIFYLFHMAIVALLLARWQAIAQGIWALLLYAALIVGEWREWLTPHYSFLPNHQIAGRGPPEFGFAALLVVAGGILGMLYFTRQIASRLEKRERELRLTNTALRRSQAALKALQRRRSRFMQTAAHQLKTPLAMIQTLTELIRTSAVPPDAIPETCDKIVRRCTAGIAQVSELLTLARVQEADPARHQLSRVDVRQLIVGLCERFMPIARKKDLDLSCRLPETGELHVSVDPQDLSDCVGNLIENAINYTPGPGSVTVSTAVEAVLGQPEQVAITVTDTGIGVPPEILLADDGALGHAPAFDAFRRGDNAIAAGIPGTGLGLSIVREIVDQAGGRIRVTSRPGEGSSFTVCFPTHRPAAGQL